MDVKEKGQKVEMASGRADYHVGVDVAYQALTEMIVRPKYGGGLIASGSKEVTASIQNTLVSIAGTGMTYGGSVWLDYTLTQANSRVLLGCEGVAITDLSFKRLNDYRITKPASSVVFLNRYDPISFIYSVGISYGVTFESSLILNYLEEHGTTPTVHYRLIYALI